MAKIKTKNGTYKYNQIDIYAGMKRINKDISFQNLIQIQNILEKVNIYWGFIFGTVLGAIREKDFIAHDEDIDLFILDTDECKLIDALFVLRENGFELIRYDKGGIYSFIKNNEYVDFYVFKPYKKGIYHCGSYYLLEKHLKETIFIDFRGGEFRVPKDYEEYLEITYGDDWQTPIEYFQYSMSKKDILKAKIEVRIKRNLPQFIFDWLQYRHGSFRRIRFYERLYKKKLDHLIS